MDKYSLNLNTVLTAVTLLTILAGGGFWLMDIGGTREKSAAFRSDTTAKIVEVQSDVDLVKGDLLDYKKEQSTIQSGIRDNLATMNTMLGVISEKLKNDERQDRSLSVLDERVRKLETKQ